MTHPKSALPVVGFWLAIASPLTIAALPAMIWLGLLPEAPWKFTDPAALALVALTSLSPVGLLLSLASLGRRGGNWSVYGAIVGALGTLLLILMWLH